MHDGDDMTVAELREKYKNAYEVLVDHWDRRIPVAPKKIALNLDMEVRSINPFGEDGNLSGKFQLEDGVPVCYYNSTEASVRQRFTIAHEIGHYVLGHGDSLRDPAANFSASAHNYKETEANNFAAQLLMPKASLINDVRDNSIHSIESLSRRYKVSQVAMKYRLKNLGLIR